MNETLLKTTATLRERWNELRKKEPSLRIRNAAAMLDVSEVELLATRLPEGVTRLKPEFVNILKQVPALGRVMALTRNEYVVHERNGAYVNPRLNDSHVGLFVGADIDLRIFFDCWGSAFAVAEDNSLGTRHSLQFFAKDGAAVHKIYLIQDSNSEAYRALVAEFRSDDQSAGEQVEPMHPTPKGATLNEEQIEAFRKEWLALADTHDFFDLLRKYKLDRTQALRYAPEGGYAVPVDNGITRKLLEMASRDQVPNMVFVGNRGMLQIHSGEVNKVMEARGWFNVLDPEFSLHLQPKGFAESWIVRKPAEGDVIHSVEVFDSERNLLVQFFGKRKPGIPELESWRKLVRTLESECKQPVE